MPKGKFCHVPKLAGRYAVLGVGEARVKYALVKVHFQAANLPLD